MIVYYPRLGAPSDTSVLSVTTANGALAAAPVAISGTQIPYQGARLLAMPAWEPPLISGLRLMRDRLELWAVRPSPAL